jgi:tRNA nucleotidyltransferase (CCA-adding enzyme)
LKWGAHHIDLARSREETYARPGALPTVRPGSIEHDLFRRDFTINAMAISLNADDWGRLVDVYGGHDDLVNRRVRVLHPGSFIDDATRIWRAVRYEQRLDFCIEPQTLALLQRDRPMLKTITPDRLRYELESVLSEAAPEKVFRRADELGLLESWHSSLLGDEWLVNACASARSLTGRPSPEVYLALLAWRLSASQKEELVAGLRLTRPQVRALRDSTTLARNLELLASQSVTPSGVYRLLHGLADDALDAARAALDSPAARQNIERFIAEWRCASPALTGEDLKRLGVSQGPDIKQLLGELRDLRLDGVITTREQEQSHVQDWLGTRRI